MEHISHIWPTIRSLADDLGTPYTTVHSWSVRGRIPPDRDLDLIEAAKRHGATLTLEQLARARRAQTQEGAAWWSRPRPLTLLLLFPKDPSHGINMGTVQ
ncbi:hypothetical protein [Paracoccus siganidrum]|uniref:hypothetical protein n=1 Tax=Paracoccus siganidrum TaxID=1276757 RepID=UPI000F2D4763|nr:hypothetical protein [Paracoccus siganidrum]RMC39345.1 hypothetical protein C9E82_05040 [Paracoccus siganidrum]